MLSNVSPDDQKINFQNNFETTDDIITHLPVEVLTNIFAELGHRILSYTICLVSKQWNVIASQDILWCSWAAHLDIPEKERNQGNNKKATIGKIIRLNLCIKKGDLLLRKSVKTKQQLASAFILLQNTAHRLTKEYLELSKSLLATEITEKQKFMEEIKKGFKGHLLLRRIGLSCMEAMQAYAHTLRSSYESQDAWESIASEHIRENQLYEVAKILDDSEGEKIYYQILDKLVTYFCTKDHLDGAFQLLENRLAFLNSPQNLDLLIVQTFVNHGKDPIYTLLTHAQKKKRFDICEKMITKYTHWTDSKQVQTNQMLNLIETLLEEKQEQNAKELIEKYSEQWKKNLKDHDEDSVFLYSSRMIPLYVQTKNYRQAWKLALQDRSENKNSLHTLHKAFLDANLFDEAKEVEERLNLLNLKET